MPFPLLQALLLLLLLPLLAVSQISVSLLLCSLYFRGAIMSWTRSYFSPHFVWLIILEFLKQITSQMASLKIVFFFFFLAICFFHFLSFFCLFLLFILDFKFILISPPMLGCTVLSLVNVCLFPQSARSAGLRVIPTAWHFRLWVCLPLLTSPTSIIPPSNPSIFMYWQTLMWTNSSQLTKGLSKHSSIRCNVVLFCLWVCILTRQITLNLAEANFACYVVYSPADTWESNVLF